MENSQSTLSKESSKIYNRHFVIVVCWSCCLFQWIFTIFACFYARLLILLFIYFWFQFLWLIIPNRARRGAENRLLAVCRRIFDSFLIFFIFTLFAKSFVPEIVNFESIWAKFSLNFGCIHVFLSFYWLQEVFRISIIFRRNHSKSLDFLYNSVILVVSALFHARFSFISF